MDDGTPKQQIVERIKNATNILVTVSRDPSVDELSAALALTLILNKLDKHATAVFSGKVPPAITFLEPNKTFENTVDSLRDFIIALDKEKADRLRYKVEDDVVRIFITPYRTTITEKDLQFSQGDFNVELIVALGVEKREDLDTAVTAHGRILHDAATVTLNTKEDKNSLGVVDWQDLEASSLCEMLVNLSEQLQPNLFDQQIATALLTGIVSATKRFANEHTSPRVMTVAAQLMAAGANQQLIASKLEEAQAIPPLEKPPAKDGTTKLDEGASEKLQKEPTPVSVPAPEEKKPQAQGEMSIAHGEAEPEETKQEELPIVPKADSIAPAASEASKELDDAIAKATKPTSGISVADLKEDLDSASKELDKAAEEPKIQPQSWRDKDIAPPSMGGTLNATTEDAEEAKREEDKDDRNRTILTHDKPMGEPDMAQAPFNSYATGVPHYEPPSVDPLSQPASGGGVTKPQVVEPTAPLPSSAEPKKETIADLEADAHVGKEGLGDARRQVEDALNAAPFEPAHQPVDSLNAQPLSLPHIEHKEEQLPQFAPPPATPLVGAEGPKESTPVPPPPPMPDFSTLPPLPPSPPQSTLPVTPQQVPPASSTPPSPPPVPPQEPPKPAIDDPTQFKIPGQ